MSQLFLCEKPSQAKALAKHLGASFSGGAWHTNGITVVAAQGHLLELAKIDQYIGKKKWAIEDLPVLPNEWVLQVKEGSEERFKTISHYIEQADHVVIATDPDEEGELIGRDIVNANYFKGKISRLWVSALNTEGLSVALANLLPLSATDGYYRAASLRRKLDWLFGMNLSRAFSVFSGKTTHVGRIKTRLLAELVKRDHEIAAFKPVTYHHVTAKLKTGETMQYVSGVREPALLDDEPLSRLSYLSAGVSSEVTSVSEDNIEVAPPLPYTLSSLLMDAAALGVSLTNGNLAAQALYEAGAISYPRSGSTDLPSAGNTAFAAHSAIMTTGALPADSTSDMSTIFSLVQNNLQLQAMGATTINRRTALINVSGHVFKLHEQWIPQGKEGFVRGVQADHAYKSLLGRHSSRTFRKGEKLVIDKVSVQKLATEAPAPYNEASILKMMMQNGVGTEATRVNLINSLTKDGVAVSSAQANAQGAALSTPVILSSTKWAQDLASILPDSVLGEEMTVMIKNAQNAARRGDSDLDKHLLDATKWMMWVMPLDGEVLV